MRLLLRQLAPLVYECYYNFIFPSKTKEICFKEIIELLSNIFGDKMSLFNTPRDCWNSTKKRDFITFVRTVNRMCESFKRNALFSYKPYSKQEMQARNLLKLNNPT